MTKAELMARAHSAGDLATLDAAIAAVKAAGEILLQRFSTVAPRFADRDAVVAAIHANDAAALAVLRAPLLAARAGSQWAEDELAGGELPPGEWWIVDSVEGNINHIHGMTDWAVTATLIKDNVAVLTAIHMPLTGETYSAMRGGGAFRDGVLLRASAKTALDAALVGTGQAKPGETSETFRRIGQSVVAMLESGLVLRVSVPATLQLVHVAAGRMDVFWQYSNVRSGLAAGALLVAEAGGTISDIRGRAWSFASPDFLAATPGLHAAAVDVLAAVS